MPNSFSLRPTEKIAYPDLKIGIPTLMLCIELFIMSILHVFAFPWQPYRIPTGSMNETNSTTITKQGGFLGVLAFIDALNVWDLVKALGRAARWLFVGFRHRKTDPSYNLISKTTSDQNVVVDTKKKRNQAPAAYFELAEYHGESESPFDDVHPRAVDTLL